MPTFKVCYTIFKEVSCALCEDPMYMETVVVSNVISNLSDSETDQCNRPCNPFCITLDYFMDL